MFETISSIQVENEESWREKIFLTIDIDWAHDEILLDTIELVEEAGVAVTWFVTHETEVLERLRSNPRFELGVHPNFNFLLQGDARNGGSAGEVISNVMQMVPEATSVRSHSMTQSSVLLAEFKSVGITHDCNHFIPSHVGITLKPWYLWNGVIKVPYAWEDDLACEYGIEKSPISQLNWQGINVFDFHPIHVYKNTESMERYERTRAIHQQPQELLQHRFTGRGTRTSLLELLEKYTRYSMKVAVIGRSEILYETIGYLKQAGHSITCIITAREAPEYTKGADDFHKLANEMAIPAMSTPTIADAEQMIRETGAEVAVSINYVGIIGQAVIDLFPLGILNAHGGDLPRYRGNACQAWAILNGEEKIGLCVHRMVGGELDSGDIISRDFLQIDINTKVTQAWEWMHLRIPALFADALEKLARDPEYILEQQSTEARDILRCYPRRPTDGCIVWQNEDREILRLINASNRPYAGAYCTFNGEKMIIWEASLAELDENYCAVPGQVIRTEQKRIIVACKTGAITISTVEYRGEVGDPGRWVSSIRMRLE